MLYEKGAALFFQERYPEAEACFGEVARIEPGIAVEAARQASADRRPPARASSQSALVEPLGPLSGDGRDSGGFLT